MHLRSARRALSGGQSCSFPDRDAAGLPAPWLSRDLHVAPGAERLLFERLASAPIADKREDRAESLHAEIVRGGALSSWQAIPGRFAAPPPCKNAGGPPSPP